MADAPAAVTTLLRTRDPLTRSSLVASMFAVQQVTVSDMYEYKVVRVKKVVDGDTTDFTVDTGFSNTHSFRCRYRGIDTPECRTSDPLEKIQGKISKAYVKRRLKAAKTIMIQTHKDKKGKFGRMLGTIWLDDDELSLNEQMIEHNYAVRYFGQSKLDIETEHLNNRERLKESGEYPVGSIELI